MPYSIDWGNPYGDYDYYSGLYDAYDPGFVAPDPYAGLGGLYNDQFGDYGDYYAGLYDSYQMPEFGGGVTDLAQFGGVDPFGGMPAAPTFQPSAMPMMETMPAPGELPGMQPEMDPEAFLRQGSGQGSLVGPPGFEAPPPAVPPRESAITRAGRAIGGMSPTGKAQALLGVASLASLGAGLATRVPKVSGRMTPQEQQATQAMTAARQRSSGTMASRGYAGEEGIRETLNRQLQGMLEGDATIATPRTTRRIEDARRQVHDRLRQEIGPGYYTSTAGQNALKNFEDYAEEVLAAEEERMIGTRSGMALSRSQFARQLEMDPFEMARAEAGTLAPFGTRQAQAQAVNATTRASQRNALIGTAGQAGGLALAPWLYDAFARGRRA